MQADRLHDIAGNIIRLLDDGGVFVDAWPLVGGISAQVFGIEYTTCSGAQRRVVVRRHGSRDIARNPDIARNEFRLLELLHEHGIAVPAPVFLDESRHVFDSPYLVVEYVDGESSPGDMPVDAIIDQIAPQLAAIHRVEWQAPIRGSLPDQNEAYQTRIDHRPAELAHDMGEDLARAALRRKGRLAHVNQTVLLHGDFWPGNLMWRDGRIAAVIDWEDAAFGDPLADLANCRMEILFAFGIAAMDSFTRRYVELSPIDIGELPYWDLFAAIGPVLRLREWGLSPDAESSMLDRHGAFVRQALQCIATTTIRS